MRWSKPSLKRLKYRTRALLNLGCIALALLLFYAAKGFPYLSQSQDLHYSLRRSLADKAEIIYQSLVPDGLGTWGDEAEETVYLLRWQDTVGAMRTMRESAGSTVFGGPNRYVQKYESRGGFAIVPLYGAFPDENGHGFNGLTVAVVPLDPAVERVEVLYQSGSSGPSIHPAREGADGVFIAAVDPGAEEGGFLGVDVYDDLLAYNYLGAVGYGADGEIIAKTESAWSVIVNENG